ncbi:ExeA family protein [Candidatus Omnitrophota bacterium]
MYESYWGLKEKPFENTPDARYVYYAPKHEEAFSRILYAVREKKPAAILTGEYGTGKTLLTQVLVDELTKDNKYRIASILNPRLSSAELIREIISQLGSDVEYSLTKVDLLNILKRTLLNNTETGKHNLIIIDEAQTIVDNDVFEELRLLLNFQFNNKFLLSLILVGQTELIEKIKSLPHLRQRISVRYHLGALEEPEIKLYIQHRLRIAGGNQDIFEDNACKEIYLSSFGLPRQINNICDLALLVGFGKKVHSINGAIVKQVFDDLEGLFYDQKEKTNKE